MIGVGLRWPVGHRLGGSVCVGVLLLVGCVAIVGCLGMFGSPMCCGVGVGRRKLQVWRSRLWGLGGRWRGMVGMVWVHG